MATSGVTAFSRTARELITDALIDAKVIASGETPTSDEMTDGIRVLNEILKGWQMRDVSLWRETNGDLSIPADDASVALPAGIRDVVSARYLVSANNERPMARIEREEYGCIPNKAQSGSPTLYYISRQRDAVVMYVWPVPTATATIKIDYDRIVETVTDETQTVDIPEEDAPTLVAKMAVRFETMFNDAGMKDPELAGRAALLERDMFDADRPESYIMGVR